ncbi:MAG: class I SAM-dependent methyltransferase [Alphaproteobacteria bacterium]
MADENDAHANWNQASRHWAVVGSPLRPCGEDVAAIEGAIGAWAAAVPGRAPDAIVLGVTPELVRCRWPTGVRLTAVDNSRPMIDALWPGPGRPDGARVTCADWRALPLGAGSTDIVVGDGAYAALALPTDGHVVNHELLRVMRPGGILGIRVFLRPDAPETMAGLAAEIAAGRIGSIHALKWRMAASVQPSLAAGARLGDIWLAWQQLAPFAAGLAGRQGWTGAETASLARYRDNATRYHFPTRAEFRAIMGTAFEEIACTHGTYELADRCPTFVFRRS